MSAFNYRGSQVDCFENCLSAHISATQVRPRETASLYSDNHPTVQSARGMQNFSSLIEMKFNYKPRKLNSFNSSYLSFFTTKNRRVAPPFIPSWATSSARRLMGRHNIGDKQNVTKRIN